MGSWGCPHEIQGCCQKVAQRACNPGMKGCVLAGRYFFANDEAKNARLRHKQQALESKVMMPQGSDGPNQN
jgi:hypothetical protein